MSVLTFTEISTLVKDALVANTSTDAPIDFTAEGLRAINDAYSSVWELSGGALKNAASATLWTTASTATGVVVGALSGVKDILHLWASSTSGSVGVSSGDNELDRLDLSRIQRYRKMDIAGTYDRPKVYAITRIEFATPASQVVTDVGKFRLDYFPSVTGFYFPADYLPEFTPMDGGASDAPSVNDLESHDIAWMAAADLAPRIGRADLVPSILMKVSDGTSKALARKLKTLLDASQKAA